MTPNNVTSRTRIKRGNTQRVFKYLIILLVNMRKNNCEEIERWIVKYANSARKKGGIATFRTNWGLTKIARNHSGRMARAKKIWHGDGVHKAGSSLTNKSFWDFVKSIFYIGCSGENVGLMFRGRVQGIKRPVRTNMDIALAQHKTWMRSSGHRANLLNSNFSLIGAGLSEIKTDIIALNYFMDKKMANKIFMLYGAHDIKVMYGLKNFKNCLKQFKRIVRRNKLKYEDIISIIENSVIDSMNIGIDPKKSSEDYVKKKTELEKNGLERFLKKEDSFCSKIIEKFRGKSEGNDDFIFQLMKFLKKKRVVMVFEENSSEVVKKDIEYGNKNMEEIVTRILRSSNEVDNMRDELMINQITQLGRKHPDKKFVIVRGACHKKLSNNLRQAGFNVSDYTY